MDRGVKLEVGRDGLVCVCVCVCVCASVSVLVPGVPPKQLVRAVREGSVTQWLLGLGFRV